VQGRIKYGGEKMTRTIEIEAYEFGELDDGTKERVRERFRQTSLDYTWWNHVYDDIKHVGKIIGIKIDEIYFTGFGDQGDGACFEGSYGYAKGSVKGIAAYAPQDVELHRIARGLQAIQRQRFYGLYARVRPSYQYMHENCTCMDVYDHRKYGTVCDLDVENSIKELLRDFMCWMYKRLETEYEYLTSDACIEEFISSNDCVFTANGKLL
jgi:hypothetical protein